MTCSAVLVIPDSNLYPSISVADPLATVYEDDDSTTISQVTVTTQASPDTVTLTYTLGGNDPKEKGTGTLDSSVTPGGGVTVTPYDSSTGKFIIEGDVAGVNLVAAGVKYNAPADEKSEIPIHADVVDSEGNESLFCDDAFRLVPPGVLYPFKQACTETLTLSGTTGHIDIRVENTDTEIQEVLTSMPIDFITDIPTTVAAIVSDINGNATKFEAEDLGSGTFRICALERFGSTANTWIVVETATGDLALSGEQTLSGGVTGKVNPKAAQKQKGDESWDKELTLLGALAGPIALLAPTLFGRASPGKLTVTRDDDNPVNQILLYVQANGIPVPDIYDPDARTMSDTFDNWKAGGFEFVNVFTDNPAWLENWFVTDTVVGAGNLIELTTEQLELWYEDIFNASLRCDESVDSGNGSEPRYTANAAILNKRTYIDIINDIASIMHATIDWQDGMRLVQDRPSDPVDLFNITNVIDNDSSPGFTYSGNSLKLLYNTVEVSYNSPDQPNKKVSVIVSSDDPTVPNADIFRVFGFGIAQLGQALRHAKRLLLTQAVADPLTIRFIGYHNCQNIKIGDKFWVFDQYFEKDPLHKNSGRILENISATSFLISNSNPIETDADIKIKLPDGTIQESTVMDFVDNLDGTATIEIADSITLDPVDYAVYGIGPGKIYTCIKKIPRVMNVEWEIEAVRHDPDIYDAIDTALTFPS